MSGAASAATLAALNAGAISVGTAATISSVTAAVASVASVALPLAGVASSVMGARSQVAAGEQQAASANYNAAIAANNAQIATQNASTAGQVGSENVAIEQQKTRATIGGIKATQAANGIDINSGSAVDVRSSASELGELNAITIRSNAARTAYGYQTQAESDKAQAGLDKEEAKYDTEAGYIKGGTTLLSSAVSGNQSGLWDSFNQKNSINAGGN